MGYDEKLIFINQWKFKNEVKESFRFIPKRNVKMLTEWYVLVDDFSFHKLSFSGISECIHNVFVEPLLSFIFHNFYTHESIFISLDSNEKLWFSVLNCPRNSKQPSLKVIAEQWMVILLWQRCLVRLYWFRLIGSS